VKKSFFIFLIAIVSTTSFTPVFSAGEFKDLQAGTYIGTIENYANSGKNKDFTVVLEPDLNGNLVLNSEKSTIPVKDTYDEILPKELTFKNANGSEITLDLTSRQRIDNQNGTIKVDTQGKVNSPTITNTGSKSVVTVAPSTGLTLVPAAGGVYTLLAPIPTFFPDGKIDIKGKGLSGYLEGLYRVGVAIATGLALIMIVVGGLEYVSTDSIQGKSSGRERIKNALIGLLLALTSFIILRQINPNLLRSDLGLDTTGSVGGIDAPNVNLTSGNVEYAGLGQFPYTQGLINSAIDTVPGLTTSGSFPGSGVLSTSAVAARIVQSARANLDTSTCFAITEYGRKGCGYAFGKIMTDAGVTFRNLNSSALLSTSNIYSVLAGDPRFALVAINSTNGTLPGDIIISPTTPVATGHVGIIEQAGASRIISNSSSAGSIQDYFTGQKWLNYYGGKGLKTYVFRYR